MPDNFNVACGDKNRNITIVCGDSYGRSYNIEEALEVVFQSPSFSYEIPLYLVGNEWTLQFTPQQTQIIDEGTYNYQIKARYDLGVVKTVEEGLITFLPSIFPMYKSYPVVIKDYNPLPNDTKYGVPTLWYNKANQTLWALESNNGTVAMWKKTSNLSYLYQSEITEDFKFLGDTTMFSLLEVIDKQDISIIEGFYNVEEDKTEYNIHIQENKRMDFYLYIDKTIENKPVLGTFEEEVDPALIIYRYTKYVEIPFIEVGDTSW